MGSASTCRPGRCRRWSWTNRPSCRTAFRIARRTQVAPIDDHLEIGELLARAHDADRLAGTEQHPVLPRPGVGVSVDVGEVVFAERAPAGPRTIDERPGRCLREGGLKRECQPNECSPESQHASCRGLHGRLLWRSPEAHSSPAKCGVHSARFPDEMTFWTRNPGRTRRKVKHATTNSVVRGWR